MNTVETRMAGIIRRAVAGAGAKRPLVAMLRPGHSIPLVQTCGAVLDHDLVRIEDPLLGWSSVIGKIRSGDSRPRTVSIPMADIVWIHPDVAEVR